MNTDSRLAVAGDCCYDSRPTARWTGMRFVCEGCGKTWEYQTKSVPNYVYGGFRAYGGWEEVVA